MYVRANSHMNSNGLWEELDSKGKSPSAQTKGLVHNLSKLRATVK